MYLTSLLSPRFILSRVSATLSAMFGSLSLTSVWKSDETWSLVLRWPLHSVMQTTWNWQKYWQLQIWFGSSVTGPVRLNFIMNVSITCICFIYSINQYGPPNPHTPNSLNLILWEYQVWVGGYGLDSYKRVIGFQSIIRNWDPYILRTKINSKVHHQGLSITASLVIFICF